jgi:coenzyme F420 biosynthesis associated uncharacterized protein
MIDWPTAERVAAFVAGSPPGGPFLIDRLPELAADSEARVVAYTGMTPERPLPPPEAVGRREWISSNLDTMRPLLDPLSDRMGEGFGSLAAPVRLATGLLLAGQIGVLTGYLAQRVLGQYELRLLDTSDDARLLFVAPNLAEAATRLEADRDELVKWVAFHEVTHAVQFAAVPWLREYLGSLLRDLIDSLEVRLDRSRALRLPAVDDLRSLVEALRGGDLISLAIGRERAALVDRIQATMAVVEGHAEHVMDAVAVDVLPSLEQLRAALERRRQARSTPLRLFERLLGLELKLRQYRDGKRFCDEVVAQAGVEGLNRVWSSAEALPSLAELARPADWLARTSVPSVTS